MVLGPEAKIDRKNSSAMQNVDAVLLEAGVKATLDQGVTGDWNLTCLNDEEEGYTCDDLLPSVHMVSQKHTNGTTYVAMWTDKAAHDRCIAGSDELVPTPFFKWKDKSFPFSATNVNAYRQFMDGVYGIFPQTVKNAVVNHIRESVCPECTVICQGLDEESKPYYPECDIMQAAPYAGFTRGEMEMTRDVVSRVMLEMNNYIDSETGQFCFEESPISAYSECELNRDDSDIFPRERAPFCDQYDYLKWNYLLEYTGSGLLVPANIASFSSFETCNSETAVSAGTFRIICARVNQVASLLQLDVGSGKLNLRSTYNPDGWDYGDQSAFSTGTLSWNIFCPVAGGIWPEGEDASDVRARCRREFAALSGSQQIDLIKESIKFAGNDAKYYCPNAAAANAGKDPDDQTCRTEFLGRPLADQIAALNNVTRVEKDPIYSVCEDKPFGKDLQNAIANSCLPDNGYAGIMYTQEYTYPGTEDIPADVTCSGCSADTGLLTSNVLPGLTKVMKMKTGVDGAFALSELTDGYPYERKDKINCQTWRDKNILNSSWQTQDIFNGVFDLSSVETCENGEVKILTEPRITRYRFDRVKQ
jgi:hypothetical protein